MALVFKKSSLPQGILQSLKRDYSIKNLIHSSLAGWEKPRPHGVIHASDLMKPKEFCPREWAFLDLGVIKKQGEFLGTAMRITFDHGRDMEYRLRNEWIRDYAVGYWKCGVCGHVHEKFGKEPKIPCPKCKWGHQWEYHEVRLMDKESGISGGIDLFVDVGAKKLKLVEIKSMDKDEHKTLAAPLAEHKFRTALYLKLADHSGLPESDRIDQQEAVILYVSKSFGFKDESLAAAGIKDSPFSPFKEFPIQRNDALVETAVAKATALTKWRTLGGVQGESGLPCGVCSSALSKRATQCGAVTACFSGKYASTITWMENGVPKHQGKPFVV